MGEGAELQALIEKVRPWFVRWLYRRVGNREDAEGIAQEAFAGLWERRSQVRQWSVSILLREAMFRATDLQRRNARHARNIGAVAEQTSAEEHANFEDQTIDQLDAYSDAAWLLARMTEKERQCIIPLAYGKQYHEIAAMLGIPVGTVKSRINLVRTQIAKRIGPVDVRNRKQKTA